MRRGLLAAAAVGVLLLVVNPGPRVFRTGLPSSIVERSLLTFVICYGVSVFSALAAARMQRGGTIDASQGGAAVHDRQEEKGAG